jgi:hypothetical protein
VRPARGHGQGQDRGRGLAPPADRAVRHPRGPGAALQPRRSRARPDDAGSASTASSTAWPSGIEQLPDRLLVYTADGEAARPPPTSAASGRPASSSGAARSRTSSSGSPAAAWSSDDRRSGAPVGARGPAPGHVRDLAPLAARTRARPARLPARLAQLPALGLSSRSCTCSSMGIGLGLYVNKQRRRSRRRSVSRLHRPGAARDAGDDGRRLRVGLADHGQDQWDKTYQAALNTPIGATTCSSAT